MEVCVNGVKLYYEVMGSGRPLLMVHGNGENHEIFQEAAEVLSERFTCYLVDSRGHGKSQPVDSLSYDTMADDMIAFMKEMNLKDPVFYGFSDGGIIGLLAAIREPEFIKYLIVSGANSNPDGVKNSLGLIFKLIYKLTKDAKIGLMLHEPHITADMLANIKAKTLVLAGERDLIKEEDTDFIAEHIPYAKKKILPGEGHGSYIVHSTKIAKIIMAAVRK